MSSRLTRRAGIVVLCVSLMAAGIEILRLRSAALANEAIEALLSGRDLSVEQLSAQPLPVLWARAVYLGRNERVAEAQDLLNYLGDHGDAALRARISYNLGNLLLRQALSKIEAGEIDQAGALVSLAKDAFRRSLVIDPEHWDSKYNLEVAMRLLPEMERMDSSQEDARQEHPQQLWTNIPGFPRGQP